jgi:hypothetical protein
MKNLTKLVVYSNKIIGFENFIQNSPNIRILQIDGFSLDEKTIEAFVERAINKPKIEFKLILPKSIDKKFLRI